MARENHDTSSQASCYRIPGTVGDPISQVLDTNVDGKVYVWRGPRAYATQVKLTDESESNKSPGTFNLLFKTAISHYGRQLNGSG